MHKLNKATNDDLVKVRNNVENRLQVLHEEHAKIADAIDLEQQTWDLLEKEIRRRWPSDDDR